MIAANLPAMTLRDFVDCGLLSWITCMFQPMQRLQRPKSDLRSGREGRPAIVALRRGKGADSGKIRYNAGVGSGRWEVLPARAGNLTFIQARRIAPWDCCCRGAAVGCACLPQRAGPSLVRQKKHKRTETGSQWTARRMETS